MRVVMKFGGTSVGSGERIRGVARIVKGYHEEGHEIAVVVSAMSGVTDSLLLNAKKTGQGRSNNLEEFLDWLTARHMSAAKDALSNPEVVSIATRRLEDTIDELGKILEGIARIGELTQRSLDFILSFGEGLIAPVVSSALVDAGLSSEAFTGGEAGIVTDDRFGEARPLMNLTSQQVRERLLPIMRKGSVPVVAGFTGVTQTGAPSTMGRGGSDFTASILGTTLKADEVWVWKDVDGIMTANPEIVPEAKVMPSISFAEAIEMAHFGSEIVHPRALELASEHGLPLRVKNSFKPQNPGTLISTGKEVKPRDIVKSVSLIEDVGMITVSGATMIGSPRITAKVLQILAENDIDVLMISQSSSQANISIAVPKEDLDRAMNSLELALLGSSLVKEIVPETDLSIVATVGAGMKGTPGVAARVFSAIAKHRINVRTIAQGSSELNISFVVDNARGKEAVRILHEDFILGGVR